MAIAPGTQEFAELKQTIESNIIEGNITSKAQVRSFLEQQGVDYNNFMQVDADYEKQKAAGFDRESTFDPGKIIGSAVGKVAEDIGTLGGQGIELVAGKESRKYIEGALKDAADYVDSVLPKSVSYALKETFDPRVNVGEDIAAELTAFAAPVAGVTKLAKPIKVTSKLGKAAKAGAIGVTADVLTRDEDEQFTTELISLIPEAEEYVQALAIDPDDSVAEKRLKQIVDSGIGAGVITIGLAPAMLALKFGGKKLIGKFKALKKDDITKPIETTPTTTVINPQVAEIAPGVYRQQGRVKEVIGKINTKLGRALTSVAALPEPVFKSFIKKQQFVEAEDLLMRKEAKTLKKLIKDTGTDVEPVSKLLRGETLTAAERQSVPQEIIDQASVMRQKMDDNSIVIKDLLELNPDDELALALDAGGGSYITRTFEFSSNPQWSKDITAALKGRQPTMDQSGFKVSSEHNTNILNIVNNARSYIARNNPDLTASQIDGLIQSMVDRGNKGDALGVIIEQLGMGGGAGAAKILKSRKTIDKPILELFGEVKDPIRNFSETITNQNKLIAKARYLKEIKNFAEQNVGREIKLGGLIPGLPTDVSTFLRKAETDVTKNLGELAAKELGSFGAGGETLGLNKFVTTDQLHTMLDTGIDTFSLNNPVGKSWLNIFAKPAAVGQAAETVFDHTAHLVNTYGMAQQLAMNGNLFRPSVFKNAQKAAYTIYQKAAKKDPEALQLLAELKKRGVIDSSVVGETIKKNIDNFGEGLEDALTKTLKAPFRGMSAVYGGVDDFGKLIAIQAEMNAYRKAFPNLTEEQLLDKAAEVVRNTMPSYTTALPAVRALSRLPFGTYATFPAEVLRTQKNIISQGVRDIAEGTRTGNQALALTGLRRLSGIGATTAAIDMMVSDNNEQMGVTDVNKRAIKLTAPDYQKNTVKVYTEPFYMDPKTGHVMTKFTDSGSLDAAQYVKGPIRAIIGRVMAGDEVTEREINDAFKEGIAEVYSPFVSEKFLTTALLNISRGVDAEGKPIKSVQDELLKAFTPGSIKAGQKVLKAQQSELLRGEGKGQTVSGFPMRAEDAMRFFLTGVRNNTVDVSKAVGFSVYQDLKEINKSKQEFKQYLKDIPDKPLTESDIKDLYQKYIDTQLEKKENMARLADKVSVFKDIEFYKKGKDGKMYKQKFGLENVFKASTDNAKYKPDNNFIYSLVKGKEGNGIFMPDSLDSRDIVSLIRDRKFSPEVIMGLKQIEAALAGKTLRKRAE